MFMLYIIYCRIINSASCIILIRFDNNNLSLFQSFLDMVMSIPISIRVQDSIRFHHVIIIIIIINSPPLSFLFTISPPYIYCFSIEVIFILATCCSTINVEKTAQSQQLIKRVKKVWSTNQKHCV